MKNEQGKDFLTGSMLFSILCQISMNVSRKRTVPLWKFGAFQKHFSLKGTSGGFWKSENWNMKNSILNSLTNTPSTKFFFQKTCGFLPSGTTPDGPFEHDPNWWKKRTITDFFYETEPFRLDATSLLPKIAQRLAAAHSMPPHIWNYFGFLQPRCAG